MEAYAPRIHVYRRAGFAFRVVDAGNDPGHGKFHSALVAVRQVRV
jgi:hypothetical protein